MVTPLRRSGMARILKGSYSFTRHTLYASANGMNHICLWIPSQSWYSFSNPRGMEGWVGLGWTRQGGQGVDKSTINHV